MGLMMSVLVFSVGVLEALACVEHVRQSYLPLDFGRKRRRLVLDVGSGTIRHRETRRSSEFQRDPHVFLRSIQAAVEEEGDEKESEELAAIFQAVEARNIHSTQMMNHQDAVFLTVNDIDDSDSCTSRTSTPNTVIMNMSPELERRSIVELCNIPSDSFSEYSSLQSDEVSSDQKDISIAQVDIGQFMCIPEREIPFESIHSNSGEVLQESNTQNESKHAPVCTISTELLANNKYEISERNGILSNVDIQSTDIISIPVKEYGQENAIVVENNKEKSIKAKSDNNCLILDGKNNIDINIVNKNTVSIEPPLTPPISHDTDNGCSKPRNISVLNDENVIQDNSFEINYTMIENSPTLTNTSRVESNNRETIENSKVLVKCQPHSRNEPLIENKGKDEICETQSEQVIESEKQSEKEEILSPKLDTNLVNIAHNIINNKNELGLSKGDSFYAKKEIQCIDQTYAQDDFSESQDPTITPKLKNVSFQKVLLHANELEESEMIPIKLFEIKDQVIEPAVAGRANSNASYQQIPQPETDSDSEIKITERIDDGQQVSKRLVTHKVQFDMTDPVPTKTDISNEFLKTIDPRIVNQGKELVQEIINQSLIEVNACNSMDYKHVCIDNNSNIVKQTSSDLVERNTTQPENESASQKNKTSNSNETAIIESTLISRESSLIADKNCLKEGVLSSQQERCSEEIPPIDKKSSSQKVIYTVEEESELKKIEEANVNAPNLSESIGEVSKSEEIYDVRHSENTISDIAVIKDELGLEKLGPVIKSEVVEECSHLMDMVHKEETLSCKNDKKEQIISKSIDLKQEQKVGSREEGYSENVVSKDTKLETVCAATRHSMNGSVPKENISQVESVLKEHQVDCHEEACSDIVVSKDTKVEADVNDTRQPVNGTVPNEDTNHGESISKELQVDRHEKNCSEISKDTKSLPVVADTKHQKNGSVPDENRSQMESILKNHQVDSHEEVCSEIVVSKETNVEVVDNDTRHPTNSIVSNVQNKNQVESNSSNNATRNEVSKTEKLKSSKAKKKRGSKDEITSKDLLDVKESLKPLPQKESANDKGGKPSDQKAMKKDKGVLTKQETLNVSPFRDDVTVLEGGIPSQNQFTPVEDITSPDKAFWVRELKG